MKDLITYNKDGTTSISFEDFKKLFNYDYEDGADWIQIQYKGYKYPEEVKELVIPTYVEDPKGNYYQVYLPDNCSGLFLETLLETIDLTYILDTINVTNMSGMFYACRSLTSLDLSSFNTSNVTSMYKMFYKCKSLTSLDLYNFNTSSVEDMTSMFCGCTSLEFIYLSSFDTSNVISMYSMFYGCTSLTSLDLSSFNTTSVEEMGAMFSNCEFLKFLDLSNFNTSNIKDMYHIFYACPAGEQYLEDPRFAQAFEY